jgi:hypothetical protein
VVSITPVDSQLSAAPRDADQRCGTGIFSPGSARHRRSPEAIHHAGHGGMRSVLDLDPFASAGAVAPRLLLGDDPLEPHAAGRCEKFGPDLAPLKRRYENTLSATAQKLVELTLAIEQRQVAQVLAADGDQVEGV